MEDKKYSITLSDGTVINNLSKNGDNYISESELTDDIFAGNCSPVIISDGEITETHDHMELVQITPVGNDYWFVLRDFTNDELERIKLRSDIEYISMMAGIEL